MGCPKILEGDCSVDDRGIVSFLNVLPFEKVKRSYIVENFSTDTVRAFHGHKIEEKFVLAISGAAIIVVAKMSTDIKSLEDPKRYVLSNKKLQVLHIPFWHANGFRALELNTKLAFFSTTTIDQAKEDDYRFPYDYFGKLVWTVESR